MRIGLDGLPLTAPKTGVGHYTYELALALAAVAPSSSFELAYPSSAPSVAVIDNKRPLPINLTAERVRVGLLGKHWWSVGLPRYIRQQKIELFHGTNFDVPLRRRCATVLTIHDLSQLLHPETHPRRSVSRARRRLPLMTRTADAIIVPADSIRREVCEQFKVAPDAVFVVPEAARESFRPMDPDEAELVRRRLAVQDDFLLAVGTIEPRKNLAVLIAAFNEVARAQPDNEVQLVIAGGNGWLSGPLFEAIEKSPCRRRILLTDYLHDHELRALYSTCRAFVYPSIYEGFGLPPLEAMACGAPVIASRIPTLLETLGDAAHFFDPQNKDQLTQAIIDVISNNEQRQVLIEAGLQQAEKFSWEETARSTLAVYEVALCRAASAGVGR
jgi:glycosyltransferase involved in cell wall biosynthesis